MDLLTRIYSNSGRVQSQKRTILTVNSHSLKLFSNGWGEGGGGTLLMLSCMHWLSLGDVVAVEPKPSNILNWSNVTSATIFIMVMFYFVNASSVEVKPIQVLTLEMGTERANNKIGIARY